MHGTERTGKSLLGETRNKGWKLFLYSGHGNMGSLQAQNMTNHDLREMVQVAWAMLDPDDRADLLKEMQHYQGVVDGTVDGYLSSLAFTACLQSHPTQWANRCGRASAATKHGGKS